MVSGSLPPSKREEKGGKAIGGSRCCKNASGLLEPEKIKEKGRSEGKVKRVDEIMRKRTWGLRAFWGEPVAPPILFYYVLLCIIMQYYVLLCAIMFYFVLSN